MRLITRSAVLAGSLLTVACGSSAQLASSATTAATQVATTAATARVTPTTTAVRPDGSSAPPPTTTGTATSVGALDPSETIVSVSSYGGLCVGGVACGSDVTVHADGSFTRADDGKETTGSLSPADLATLTDLIRTDAAALEHLPAAAMCASAADGQDIRIIVKVDTGTLDVSSCTSEIPRTNPLVAWLLKLLTPAG